jgi:signal transduction histidine kinase
MSNAVRHADAHNIYLTMRLDGPQVRLIVRDDGCGFDRAQVDSSTHFGLGIMADRVARVGGALHVASEPGWGTQVIVRLPPNDEGQEPK